MPPEIPHALVAERRQPDNDDGASPGISPPPLRDQIRSTWARVALNAPRTRAIPVDWKLRRNRHVARFYSELADLGLQLHRVDQLEDRHVTALLDHWRRKGKALSTIRSEWSVLRAWASAIGKDDLVRPLTSYSQERVGTRRRRTRSARHNDLVLVRSLESSSDPTYYWIERVCTVFRVTVPDALVLDFRAVLRFLEGRRVDSLLPVVVAAIATRPHEARSVAVEVLGFLASAARSELLWPSTELAQAARRHANHLAYRRRQLKSRK